MTFAARTLGASSDETYSLTAGTDGGDQVGYRTDLAPFGSLTPTTNRDGYTFVRIFDDLGTFEVRLSGFPSNPGQSYFTSVLINSTTFTSASATFSGVGGDVYEWVWGSEAGLGDSSTYPVTITY